MEKRFLATKDIESMTLTEFMKFGRGGSPYEMYSMPEIVEANTEYLRIRGLERVATIKRLREKVAQMKEDLWYRIQRVKDFEIEKATLHDCAEYCEVNNELVAAQLFEIVKQTKKIRAEKAKQ